MPQCILLIHHAHNDYLLATSIALDIEKKLLCPPKCEMWHSVALPLSSMMTGPCACWVCEYGASHSRCVENVNHVPSFKDTLYQQMHSEMFR